MGQPAGRHAFTLIELIVVAGLVLILIGLTMPSIAAANREAAAVRTAMSIRSCGISVATYVDDHDGIPPISSASVGSSMLGWDDVLVTTDYFGSLAEMDKEGVERRGHTRFAIAGALMHPPEAMEPGSTVPLSLAETAGIRLHQAAYPSQKGVLVQWVHYVAHEDRFWTWNPYDRPLSPVAWADGSVTSQRCTDFVLAHDFFENWVGHPVLATWSGIHGIDRTSP